MHTCFYQDENMCIGEPSKSNFRMREAASSVSESISDLVSASALSSPAFVRYSQCYALASF